MKVEKINITKELLDIPEKRPILKFLKQGNKSRLLDENNLPQMAEEETWIVEKVRDMHGQTKLYLVKADERELFIELIEITNSVLKTKIRKETQAIQEEIFRKITEIKNLPWWKRLLNQF